MLGILLSQPRSHNSVTRTGHWWSSTPSSLSRILSVVADILSLCPVMSTRKNLVGTLHTGKFLAAFAPWNFPPKMHWFFAGQIQIVDVDEFQIWMWMLKLLMWMNSPYLTNLFVFYSRSWYRLHTLKMNYPIIAYECSVWIWIAASIVMQLFLFSAAEWCLLTFITFSCAAWCLGQIYVVLKQRSSILYFLTKGRITPSRKIWNARWTS